MRAHSIAARRLLREASLYSVASGFALLLDIGVLWLLVEFARLHYLVAAGIAFLLGTATVYSLSILRIFSYRRMTDRRFEFGVFLAIGVLALLANLAVLKIAVDGFGLHYLIGKLMSVVVTFSLNFGLRRALLFTAPGTRKDLHAAQGPRE